MLATGIQTLKHGVACAEQFNEPGYVSNLQQYYKCYRAAKHGDATALQSRLSQARLSDQAPLQTAPCTAAVLPCPSHT